MNFPHLGGVLKLGFTSSFMPISVMMIPMMSGSMAMTMAMISPLWEGISPADSCLSDSFSLSGVFRPVEEASLL
jgi:hypothetical protein